MAGFRADDKDKGNSNARRERMQAGPSICAIPRSRGGPWLRLPVHFQTSRRVRKRVKEPRTEGSTLRFRRGEWRQLAAPTEKKMESHVKFAPK